MSGPENHTTYRRVIDEVIIEELSPRKWEKLRKHLQVCPACRSRYDKAVLAERMLHGGPQAVGHPSSAELDRIAEAVLEPEGARASGWARTLAWLTPARTTGLIAAAACLALIPFLARNRIERQPETDERLQARGGNQGPIERFSSKPELKPALRNGGVRAFCLGDGRLEALDPHGPRPPSCTRGSQLKLAVSNPGKYQKVFLVGMDAEHALKWYAPRPPVEGEAAPAMLERMESVAAPIGGERAEEVTVGSGVRLAVNHAPGPLRIYAFFSDKPVTATEIEAAAGQLAKHQVGPSEALTLPLKRPDVLQRSLLVVVQN